MKQTFEGRAIIGALAVIAIALSGFSFVSLTLLDAPYRSAFRPLLSPFAMGPYIWATFLLPVLYAKPSLSTRRSVTSVFLIYAGSGILWLTFMDEATGYAAAARWGWLVALPLLYVALLNSASVTRLIAGSAASDALAR